MTCNRTSLTNFIKEALRPDKKILPLLNIPIRTTNATIVYICALLDTGSDSSYISQDFIDDNNIPYSVSSRPERFTINTSNGTKQTEAQTARINLHNGRHQPETPNPRKSFDFFCLSDA